MKELKLKQVVCLLVQRLASSCPDICLACVKYACLRLVGTVLIDTRDGVPSNKTALIRETSTHMLLGGKHPNNLLRFFVISNSKTCKIGLKLQLYFDLVELLLPLTHLLFSFIGKPAACEISSLRALLVQRKVLLFDVKIENCS